MLDFDYYKYLKFSINLQLLQMHEILNKPSNETKIERTIGVKIAMFHLIK